MSLKSIINLRQLKLSCLLSLFFIVIYIIKDAFNDNLLFTLIKLGKWNISLSLILLKLLIYIGEWYLFFRILNWLFKLIKNFMEEKF
ncbi:hypothetical protein B6U57_01710 [Ligilactobacillus salivarius]|uniref:Uncharacterized protein n=1 Tax=Ligilactobacillus salivarius TaxID=1624 RepID=A0A1V9R6S0_9LACO|nr:hypothetical protein B6U57_01710 [Ligilactobacillus salivarius]OQQ91760.1 hypothetical protein B6U56_01720 [Ligilactobacillus salivarius]PWG51931.1 hypothetical protein DB362_06590 [Ligilactobacillus salivarius]